VELALNPGDGGRGRRMWNLVVVGNLVVTPLDHWLILQIIFHKTLVDLLRPGVVDLAGDVC